MRGRVRGMWFGSGVGAVVALGLLARSWSAAAGVVEVQRASFDTAQLRRDALVLAADSLAGRALGTRGEELAAGYVAGRLGGAGFEAYVREFRVRCFRVEEAGTTLTVEVQGRRHVFRHGRDFVLSFPGGSGLRGFSGPLSFVGSTRTLARAEEKMPPVAGQVAVAAASVWDDPDFVAALAGRGAEGVILVTVDSGEYDVVRRSRGRERYALAVDGPQLADLVSPVPVVVVTPRVTEVLFRGPVALDSEGLDARGRATALPGLLLASHARLEVAYRQEEVTGRNVVGVLASPDSLATGEAVVVVAHFDGLGVGIPDQRGDSIYNGFADNAVGVAAVLAVADALALARERLRRTVVVLASTGEERLLLGAQAYLRDPVFPLQRTVAVLNLDGIAVEEPPGSYAVNGGSLTTLGYVVAKLARARGLRAVSTPALARLDHYAFLRAGVPAVSLLPSQEPGEGGAVFYQGGGKAYHRPSDEYRPGFSFAGVAAVAEFAFEVVMHLATAPEAPRWLGKRRP